MSSDIGVDLKFLAGLIAGGENEVVEFKRWNNGKSEAEIGKYFSALSNEANLRNYSRAWLVLGVENDGSVVGSTYKSRAKALHAEKNRIQDQTGTITFREIHELEHPNGRVILFEIPAAPRGYPISCNGHYYGRVGESPKALGQDKIDEIRLQTRQFDWTAQIVDGATIKDLDKEAIAEAKKRFSSRHEGRISPQTIESWGTARFLDKAGITIDKKITRAALLLLGKQESAAHLNPHPAQITWALRGEKRGYEHFGPPFLLATARLFDRIRNVGVRMLQDGTMFVREVPMYDREVVLEALHNCVAHQDFFSLGRIVVIEKPDRLILENDGDFFGGSPISYALSDTVPRHYRNPFLIEAMVQLRMIDKMGGGIETMHRRQRERFLPMPLYETDKDSVRMTIFGSVIDESYTQILMKEAELPLRTVLALDRVQKRLPITDEEQDDLLEAGLVKKNKSDLSIQADLGAENARVEYILPHTNGDKYYATVIFEYLETFGHADRKTIDTLLAKKLDQSLTSKEKRLKVSSVLSKMKQDGIIRNNGTAKKPIWKLADAAI